MEPALKIVDAMVAELFMQTLVVLQTTPFLDSGLLSWLYDTIKAMRIRYVFSRLLLIVGRWYPASCFIQQSWIYRFHILQIAMGTRTPRGVILLYDEQISYNSTSIKVRYVLLSISSSYSKHHSNFLPGKNFKIQFFVWGNCLTNSLLMIYFSAIH